MLGHRNGVWHPKTLHLLAILLMSNQDQLGYKIKHWIKHFFGVKVIVMNGHRLLVSRKDRRMEPIMGHNDYPHMIIMLQLEYSIPPLIEKGLKSKY
ncbi:hypothetical protein AMTRI_Chr05g59920 [Amborella trichopoda]